MKCLLDDKGLSIQCNNYDILLSSEQIIIHNNNRTLIYKKIWNLPVVSTDNGETYTTLLLNTWDDIVELASKYIVEKMEEEIY